MNRCLLSALVHQLLGVVFPCHLLCCWAKLWAWFYCTVSKGQGQEANFSSCCFGQHSSSFISCTQQPCFSAVEADAVEAVLAQVALHFELGHHLSWDGVIVRVPEGVGLSVIVLRQTGGVLLFSIPIWLSLQPCNMVVREQKESEWRACSYLKPGWFSRQLYVLFQLWEDAGKTIGGKMKCHYCTSGKKQHKAATIDRVLVSLFTYSKLPG